MDKTVSVQVLRSSLDELLRDVADRRDHVLITHEGRPAAALLPIGEYEALEETVQIPSDADTVVAIDAGLAELQRDETLTLDDLRTELAERRSNDVAR